MSEPTANNLSRESIQQLLASVGSQPVDIDAQPESTEYDWRQVHSFNSRQLELLEEFTATLTSELSKEFGKLFRSDFNAEITETAQHFAKNILDQQADEENREGQEEGQEESQDGQNSYNISFGIDQEQLWGLISMPLKTAKTWARQLLGDSDSEDGTEDLSQLEESLLSDITAVMIRAFSAACGDHNFQQIGDASMGKIKAGFENTEELCKIDFKIKQSEEEKKEEEEGCEMSLLISCSLLKPVIDAEEQSQERFSDAENSNALLSHMGNIPVTVESRLGSASVTFEQLAGLQKDDVLLLDKKVNEPAEIIVDDNPLFKGHLVKCNGNFAMMITELIESKQ